MAENSGDDAFGVIRTASAEHPRYAIRFKNKGKMRAFADAQGVAEQTTFGRYKLTGINPDVGQDGLMAMLSSPALGWTVHEAMYMEKKVMRSCLHRIVRECRNWLLRGRWV